LVGEITSWLRRAVQHWSKSFELLAVQLQMCGSEMRHVFDCMAKDETADRATLRETATELRRWIKSESLQEHDPLLPSRYGQPMTRY